MGLFGKRGPRAFMPVLQAAMAGQIPGVIVEDPQAMARALGIPTPGSFGNPGRVANEVKPGAFGNTAPANDPLTISAPPQGGGMFTGPAVNSPRPPSPQQEVAPIDMMGPIKDAVYQNAMEPRPMWDEPAKKKNKIGAFLGAWAGHLGDKLTGNPVYADSLKHKRRLEEIERESQLKARLPQQVGSSVIVPDGQGGYKTLFRDPSTPEAYALAQGFEPGSAEYAEAVRQYRLGAWNDEAVEAKRGLTGYRYDRQGQLQEDRQSHATGMQEDRQQHSSGQFNRRDATTRRGQDIGRGNNVRSTTTSRDNNIRSNETRLQTSRRGRGAPVRVNSLEEARRLPPGTTFITPDGRVKVR